MSDQNPEPKVRLGGFIDPELHRQLESAANVEGAQGDLSAFASQIVAEAIAEREAQRRKRQSNKNP